MRQLLVTLLLFGLCISGFTWYRGHARAERDAARLVMHQEPATPLLSLEERAAAAQGSTSEPLPRISRSTPQSRNRQLVERAESDAAVEPYHCDGRSYCSQMHSCAEAKWFLQHCPGMNMDGEGDGIPCERQWCKHPFSP